MPAGWGSEGRTALANLFFKAVSLPVEKVLRFFVFAVAARALGVAAVGQLQFAATVTTMLALGTDLGLGIWTTRALARSRAEAASVVGTGLAMRALAAVPYLVVTAVVAYAVGPGEVRRTFILLGVAALASAFVDHFGAILRGYERMDDEARLNIARGLLAAGAGLAALLVDRSVAALAAGMMAGTIASAAYGLAILGRRYQLPMRLRRAAFDPKLARLAASEALPLWLASLLSMLYFRGDTVLLRLFAGDVELGAYSVAFKIFEGTMLVPSVLLAAVFPPLARAHGDRERQRRWEGSIVAALLGLGVLVGGVLYFGRAPIIAAAYGSGFGGAVPSLRWLALAVPLLFLNFGLTHFLIARDLGRRNLLFAAMMLVLNVALNLLVIPRYGGRGAALATVATEAALTACCLGALGWRPARATTRRRAPAAASTVHTSG